MVLVLLIAAVDCLTRANLSCLYGVPILMSAGTRPRRTLWLTLAASELLTFLVLPVKIHLGLTRPDVTMMTRLLNRSFVAVALLALAALVAAARLQAVRRLNGAKASMDGAAFAELSQAEARDGFDDLWESVLSIVAVAAAAAAIVAIAVTDMTSQAYLNPSILYAVPLALLRWCRSEALIRWAAATVLVLAVAGGFVGPGSGEPLRFSSILLQRVLVGVVLMVASWRISRGIASSPAPSPPAPAVV